jgi:hypothetical protein
VRRLVRVPEFEPSPVVLVALCVGLVVRTSEFEPSSGIFACRVVVGSLRVHGHEYWVTFYTSLASSVPSILKILLRG